VAADDNPIMPMLPRANAPKTIPNLNPDLEEPTTLDIHFTHH
jgi:hypothetical protein